MSTGILCSSLPGQTVADFGYGRLTVNGTPAKGPHPLAIVLMQYDSAPAANIAVAPPLAHTASEFHDLFFNFLHKSVNGHYFENSHGLFRWTPAGAGVYGPFNVAGSVWDPDSPTDKSSKRLAAGLQLLAGAGFNFADYDANGDGVLTKDELTVVIIDNIAGIGGANRSPNPGCFVPAGQTINVCLQVINAGDRASLMTYTHELAHQLGTMDLYGGSGGENYEYTLMGATQFQVSAQKPVLDDRRVFGLDPWHKLLLGWISPAIYSLDADGSAAINAAQVADGNSIILYSPDKGTLEYWLLEFRSATRPNGPGYDANLGGYKADQSPNPAGLVIWHVQTNGQGGENISADMTPITAYDQAGATMFPVYMAGAPNFTPGQGGVWPPNAAIPYALSWLDGNGRRVQIQVGAVSNGGDTLQVSWHAPVPTPNTTRENFLIYNMNDGSEATGYVNDATASFNQLAGYGAGYSTQWTHVSPSPYEVLYYNTYSGAARLGVVDAGGTPVIMQDFGAIFSRGWTNIVFHKSYWFFYNSLNGVAAVGRFENGRFRQYNSWSSFSTGFTSIISTPSGLLFYNASNGVSAVGDWNIVSGGTGFGYVIRVDFKQLTSAFLSAGWTHIVNTNNGVLFYNAANGLDVMVDVRADGSIITRSDTVQTIRTGWTTIAADNQNLMFYDGATGDVAIASTVPFGTAVEGEYFPGTVAGSLQMRSNYPGMFSTGWTHIVPTVPPTPPLQ